MRDIEVIKVDPLEIPVDIVWKISVTQHIALKDFRVYMQKKENKMYVHESVPEKDIEKMIEAASSAKEYIIEDDTETGTFMEYVYKTYGFAAYESLFEYHQYKRFKYEEQRAKEQLQEVLPLIEKLVTSDHPAINYNEYLIHEVSKKGSDCRMKTARNIAGYDDIYVFYLGCLVGMGKVNADDYSLNENGNIIDYYYKISEMLGHIDIREMPKIYKYLKEMYFPEQTQEGSVYNG